MKAERTDGRISLTWPSSLPLPDWFLLVVQVSCGQVRSSVNRKEDEWAFIILDYLNYLLALSTSCRNALCALAVFAICWSAVTATYTLRRHISENANFASQTDRRKCRSTSTSADRPQRDSHLLWGVSFVLFIFNILHCDGFYYGTICNDRIIWSTKAAPRLSAHVSGLEDRLLLGLVRQHRGALQQDH